MDEGEDPFNIVPGLFQECYLKVKYTLDRLAPASRKSDAISRISRELGSKATISGEVIAIESWHEPKVAEILARVGIKYTRG